MDPERVSLLRDVLQTPDINAIIDHAFGTGPKANESPPPTVRLQLLRKAALANSLADLAGDNAAFVKDIVDHPEVATLRDVAYHFGAPAVSAQSLLANDEGVKPVDMKAFSAKLFHAEPSAVLHRMVDDGKIELTPNMKSGVSTFFASQKTFNIRQTSVTEELQKPGTLGDLDPAHVPDVVSTLKTLQRVQALALNPATVPPLFNRGLVSAHQVSQVPKAQFLKVFQDSLSVEEATQVHDHAVASVFRNDQALLHLYQTIRGAQIAAIDGSENLDTRMAEFRKLAAKHKVDINLESLFGGIDYCDCDDCTTVYSPANYFVEILQYLRNNNLDPTQINGVPKFPNAGKPGIKGTALEILLKRRPDLQHLELTCENANTLIPFVDLANEVMESLVVHLDVDPEWVPEDSEPNIGVFNVEEDITSNELLAEPHHTNYTAYCILLGAVYPLGALPFHQPIVAIRIYLDFLKTSRYEMMDIFSKPYVTPRSRASSSYSAVIEMETDAALGRLHDETHERATMAEYLGIIQEEYAILTKEAFWPKEYFDIMGHAGSDLTEAQYQRQIGVRLPRDYWGYASNSEMLSDDPDATMGLQFAKKQFLKRSGMVYTELVDLVQTTYVNPLYPTGKWLVILQSLHFSYRFLQTLVHPHPRNIREEFDLVIKFLSIAQPWATEVIRDRDIEDQLDNDKHCDCSPDISREDICKFVYKWFHCIGKLVVLESGEGPTLPIAGFIVRRKQPPSDPTPPAPRLLGFPSTITIVGTLYENGTITDDKSPINSTVPKGTVIGTVGIDSKVYDPKGDYFVKQFPEAEDVFIATITPPADPEGEDQVKMIAFLATDGSLIHPPALTHTSEPVLVGWNRVVDSCNIEKVRIVHLDGSTLSMEEWDRIQRFIRLWKRLGWTIDETDKAIVGLATPPKEDTPPTTPTTPGPDPDPIIDLSDFLADDCSHGSCHHGPGCCPQKPKQINSPCGEELQFLGISPYLLKQLYYVKRLQEETSVELLKLLALWANISTASEKSLYKRLFLTHNLIGVDPVFKGDDEGNYLVDPTKIADHLPIILTAFGLNQEGLNAILDHTGLRDADLTQETISLIYRHSLLAKALLVKPLVLVSAIKLFGDPFRNAKTSLDFVLLYRRATEAGFTIPQLLYVLLGTDDPLKPLGPAKVKILKTAKTLFDGLNDIDTAHPDLKEGEQATSATATAAAGLIFDSTLVTQILGLLEGTTVYTTNAPTDLNIVVPDDLKSKIKYDQGKSGRALLTCTGILTETEEKQAKSLASSPSWAAAIERVRKQALVFFKNSLSGVFPKQDEAIQVLLSGDVVVPPDQKDPTKSADLNTAPKKLFYFLTGFLPYLRDQLTDRLIIGTVSGQVSIASVETIRVLVNTILSVEGQSAISILKGLKSSAGPSSGSGWTGYLVPSATDNYTFVGYSDTKPPPLVLDGLPVPFLYQQVDPTDVWLTDPIALTGGRLYLLGTGTQAVPGLQWKTSRSPATEIPSTALLPAFSSDAVTSVFQKISRAAIITNGFELSVDEIVYFQSHQPAFGGFDLDLPSLEMWKRMLEYTTLKHSLPTLESTLLDLFKWASSVTGKPKASEIAAQISKVTQWVATDIETLTGPHCFVLNQPSHFINDIALIKLQRALIVVHKVSVPILSLFRWSNPMAKFEPSREIAEEIRKAIRSRYTLEDWEAAAKPVHNKLRMQQRDALISYLIVQKPLVDWGVIDADGLFEFLLIDVQMGACLQTSRLKQAITTVHMFVQRCMLGLEALKHPELKNDTLDQQRWKWMSKQNVWTANRKVFLTPENYLVSSLRDDKSPLYEALEGELLQKDINLQGIQDSIKNYLFGLDQVANLEVQGIFEDEKDPNHPTYFIAKTRSEPYLFSWRTYRKEGTLRKWTPWKALPVDIPTYHAEQVIVPEHKAGEDTIEKYTVPPAVGSYVIPVLLGKRFLVFFAQLLLKSFPRKNADTLLLEPGKTAADVQRYQTWEIKLGWTELRNGKWTPKQLTTEGIIDPDPNGTDVTTNPPPMDVYRFVPRVLKRKIPNTDVEVDYIVIHVYNGENRAVGGFEFQGSQAYLAAKGADFTWDLRTSFHFVVGTIDKRDQVSSTPYIPSLQDTGNTGFAPDKRARVDYPRSEMSTSNLKLPDGSTVPFNHKFSNTLLSVANATDSLDDLFGTFSTEHDNDKPGFGMTQETTTDGETVAQYDELSSSYALYNWEMGFHTPMALSDALLQSQKFDDALAMHHHVFDPYADGDDERRVWKWAPFASVDTANILEGLFNSLKPNTPDMGPINEWRNKPFAPHVVARSRPVAYMKWTVMNYLKTLIEYGDWYFRQNSLEAVPLATQCYVLASHIYGPKGQRIPKRGKTKPQTYFSLLDKWDSFGNAIVELELSFPFSNQTPHVIEFLGKDIVLANIYGFATSHYFAIPDNPQLRAIKDLIDDRLYKIRHCQDINGNAISLALWDPPIDPALLVNAVAQGLSLSSFLNDLNSPMPNYRFVYLLQKALELCSELKSMASVFLSAKEKRDSEALQVLRVKQDTAMHNLVMEVRNLQLDEANKTLESLRTTRQGPLARYNYYAALAGASASALSETDVEYKEFALSIPLPTAEGDLMLNKYEKVEQDEALAAKEANDRIGYKEVFAGGCFAFPVIKGEAAPWGIGSTIKFGPSNIGHAATAHARFEKIGAEGRSFNSSNAARKAGHIRTYQDRVQQANAAGHELVNINMQMEAQRVKIRSAAQEITNQQKQIDHSVEVHEFLTSKYTSEELYLWLQNAVRTSFYQTYTLAYDIAKKAEMAFLFERGPQSKPFVKFGYWDTIRDGLQSGERLYVALKELEAAYQEDRGHDFEITKSVSLRQLNPYALLELRETGSCEFDLPEVLFDMDFPGHYFRRLKTVSLTLPCIVGPYTSVSCTLNLLSHEYRIDPSTAGGYAKSLGDDAAADPRFASTRVPIDAIVTSSGQNDTGTFELSFRDERYLPFEGAGTVSSWRLELPTVFRQFEYDSITDVILTLRYTAKSGGHTLREPAAASVKQYIAKVEDLSKTEGLFALFDLKSEFAGEWSRLAAGTGKMALKRLVDRLPLFTKGRSPQKIAASDVKILTETDVPANVWSVNEDVTFTKEAVEVGKLKVFAAPPGLGLPFGEGWTLEVGQDAAKKVAGAKVWLLVRYSLG